MEDDEGYDMHDGDKIGCPEIGRLIRSRNKVIINPFDDCQSFITKFYKVGQHFSKSSKNTMRFDNTKKKHADFVPNVNVSVDLDTMRVAAVRILIKYCLRMKNALKHHEMDYEIRAMHWPTMRDWQEVREVEGVLDLVRYLTTVAQHETYFVAAHGPVFKIGSCKKLKVTTIELVDLSL